MDKSSSNELRVLRLAPSESNLENGQSIQVNGATANASDLSLATALDMDMEATISKMLFCSARGDLESLKTMKSSSNSPIDWSCADYDGRTCLHIASGLGHADIVRFLIQNGANVNVKDRFGGTPLDDAVRHGQDAITPILKSAGAAIPSTLFEIELIQACAKGDVTAVGRLLRNGVSPNCADYDGRSPLHLAVDSKSFELCKTLIEFGANVAAQDRFGGSPLSDAQRLKSRVGQDLILELLQLTFNATQGGKSSEKQHKNQDTHLAKKGYTFSIDLFSFILISVQFTILILYAIFADYESATALDVGRYPYFQDVHVMIFIGFGFLMAFLRKYGYGAVGLTLLVACFAIQLHPIFAMIFEGLFDNYKFQKIHFGITTLITSDFAAAAVLISFGGLIGKVSATQLIVISIIEVLVYSLNAQIALALHITDIGGSMVIHTFGAFFGLAVSKAISGATRSSQGHPDNSAVYHSDLFAMIGTVFLFLFWPSFNAATTSSNEAFTRAVVNTLVSICGSVMAAYIASYILRGEKRFCMVDIQNSTLAGGVAIGAACDLAISPAAALLVGLIAGLVSVIGYTHLQSKVESYLGVYDTCGILNLHGMPGLIGGLVSVIACAGIPIERLTSQVDPIVSDGIVKLARSSSRQACFQLAFLVITVGIAVLSGLITGFFIRKVDCTESFFDDSALWEVPEMEKPYYFDQRGEVEHKPQHQGLTRSDVEKIFAEMAKNQ